MPFSIIVIYQGFNDRFIIHNEYTVYNISIKSKFYIIIFNKENNIHNLVTFLLNLLLDSIDRIKKAI